MSLLCTTKFNPSHPIQLNKVIMKNRIEYTKFHDYKHYVEIRSLNKNLHPSWRHPSIIIKALKNKKFRKHDFIVNTGQNNIITNFNMSIEDKMICHMKNQHKMVLQYWLVNPDILPFVPVSRYEGGPIYLKKITEPHTIIMAE